MGVEGGHKFKLSDFIPKFFKIKNVKKKKNEPIITQNINPSDEIKNPSPPPPPPSSSTSSSTTTTTITSSNTFSSSSSKSSFAISLSQGRTSLYFKRDHISSIQTQISSENPNSSNTHILKSPRISTRRTRTRSSNRVLISSPRCRPIAGTGCTCHTTTDSSVKKIITTKTPAPPKSWKDSSFIEIPPIVTKKAARSSTPPVGLKRVSISSPGVKLRTHSPRISITRRCNNNNNHDEPPRWRRGRRSLAVVKTSMNPQKDFKESMVEMIMENDIKGGKDLEDLLACYLELNSHGYHDLIIKVFKQIWFDLNFNM